MAQDFARKKSSARKKAPARKKQPARGGSGGGNGLRWYAAGVITGVFLSFLLYLGSLPPAVPPAATDPAQPYGASLRWPDADGRPARAAGAHVVIVDGDLALFVERGGKSMVSFPAAQQTSAWVDGLKALVESGAVKQLELAKSNHRKGQPQVLIH